MTKVRIDHQPAFVLHSYPYRETSLILETFTRDYGRVALVARGARRPKSALRGVLLSFAPLELGWFGSGELKTLAQAEWVGGQPLLAGEALMCGFYLNELLLKLSARDDPHPELFELYRLTLAHLAHLNHGGALPPLLRGFEVGLLRELGYGLRADVDDEGAPLEPGATYAYIIDRGPVRAVASAHPQAPRVTGAMLDDIAHGRFPDGPTLAAAKTLMRHLIHHHLGAEPLQSRRVFRELQAL